MHFKWWGAFAALLGAACASGACSSASHGTVPGQGTGAGSGTGADYSDGAASGSDANGAGSAGNPSSDDGGAPSGSPGDSGAGTTSGGGDAAGAPTSSDSETLIPDPSWTCEMPDGIPPPALGPLVFKATLQLGSIYDLGETQYGHRTLIEIKGGTLTGPKINAAFMDRGLDYQLALSNGALEVEEVNILQTSDGVPIYLRTCGTSVGASSEVRIVPDFEAPNSSAYTWLNTGTFAGTREFDSVAKTLTFEVYDVSAVTLPKAAVHITDPAGVPSQSWDCKTASGTEGTVVYTESVGIADGSVSVGASKRGTRNIIPITGGTTSGRVMGTVLSGGADYQLITTGLNLDARYTLVTHDGEMIIVRNCGPLGGLVPVFETRVAGPYAWLNANTWLSSDPGLGANVVNLTIYATP